MIQTSYVPHSRCPGYRVHVALLSYSRQHAVGSRTLCVMGHICSVHIVEDHNGKALFSFHTASCSQQNLGRLGSIPAMRSATGLRSCGRGNVTCTYRLGVIGGRPKPENTSDLVHGWRSCALSYKLHRIEVYTVHGKPRRRKAVVIKYCALAKR